MRIWSLHPRYLDQKGLVACWRETLLAQKVLQMGTVGYRNHPQLLRFRSHQEPLAAIGRYLWGIYDEAVARGYNFNDAKIAVPREEAEQVELIAVSDGQLAYEWEHLRGKLDKRAPERLGILPAQPSYPGDVHPLFRVISGPIADWEKV